MWPQQRVAKFELEFERFRSTLSFSDDKLWLSTK